jgi:hypothetical protein
MIKLEELNAGGRCGIDQKGIENLALLRVLNASENGQITNVNHLTKLEKLNACGSEYRLFMNNYSGIDQKGIENLTTLRILNAKGNNKITNVNHMIKLEELNASGYCGIDQNGIHQLTNLRILVASNNRKITNVNHMVKLEELEVYGDCGIDEIGFRKSDSIT